MSSTEQTEKKEKVVPLQPIELRDICGLKSAIYSINALHKRSGKTPITNAEARHAISQLIRNTNVRKLALLLEEWYQEQCDEVFKQDFLNELLSELPDMIEDDDNARYLRNPYVNDIEWSALATVYGVCIAVKFISRKGVIKSSSSAPAIGGWKIAVPTPQIFGVDPIDMNGADNCVFMVCQTNGAFNKYFSLIPKTQPVFSPGHAFSKPSSKQNSRNMSPTSCYKNNTSNGENVNEGGSTDSGGTMVSFKLVGGMKDDREEKPPLSPPPEMQTPLPEDEMISKEEVEKEVMMVNEIMPSTAMFTTLTNLASGTTQMGTARPLSEMEPRFSFNENGGVKKVDTTQTEEATILFNRLYGHKN